VKTAFSVKACLLVIVCQSEHFVPSIVTIDHVTDCQPLKAKSFSGVLAMDAGCIDRRMSLASAESQSLFVKDREFNKTQNLILETSAEWHFPKLKIRF
jgi:hypothetical protein